MSIPRLRVRHELPIQGQKLTLFHLGISARTNSISKWNGTTLSMVYKPDRLVQFAHVQGWPKERASWIW